MGLTSVTSEVRHPVDLLFMLFLWYYDLVSNLCASVKCTAFALNNIELKPTARIVDLDKS